MKLPLSKSGAKVGAKVTVGRHGPIPWSVTAVSPTGKVLTLRATAGTIRVYYSAVYDLYQFGSEVVYEGGVR